VVVVSGTDPVTYDPTDKEPAGVRFAEMYAFDDASLTTLTLPMNDVLPETVRVSVSPEGPAPIPTSPELYVTVVPCWLHGLVEGLTYDPTGLKATYVETFERVTVACVPGKMTSM
jgi:hypothetical protein